MNEGRTSAIFAAVAAVSLGLAFWSRPDSISDESGLKDEVTNQAVFAKFEDPDEATSFQIIKYDEALGQLDRFEVAKDKATNMWRLPSFEDYPADAAEQVRDATTPLIGLTILNVASLDRGDHTLYGVVNPDDDDLTVGESGVGMLVRVKGEANQVLAELVIGKEVEGVEKQRYVRVPTEDATYVVELDTTPFTTEFQKWINQELLEVRSFDISNIGLRDYAILPTTTGYGMSRNFDADLTFDATANTWALKSLTNYESGKPVEASLAEGERIDDKPLNDLRNAVQDLEIVNVRRKPKGLASDLKADKSLMANKESLQSLLSQGFIPQEGPQGTEIFATGGETLVGTQAGVKYLLRFGETVTDLSSQADGEESGLRRYLLVSAVLDESMFPAPDLEPLPETVEDMLALQKKNAESADAAEAAPGDGAATAPETPKQEAPTDQAPPESDKAPSENAEPAADATPKAGEAAAAEEPAKTDETASPEPAASEKENGEAQDKADAVEEEQNSCSPQEGTADDKPDQQDNAEDAASTEQAADSAAATEEAAPAPDKADKSEAAADTSTSPDDKAQASEPKKSQEELKEELEFVRERIAKENQRKIDDRKEKLDAARKRVSELNARFADWYYVVSDNVYKKLKISRDQLIVSDTSEAATTPPPPGPSFNLGN